MRFIAFKGFCAYEMQIGRLVFYFPFWKYVKLGIMPRIYIDWSND